MKHWKSLISLTLTLSMVLSLFSPVAVFAQEAAAPELSVESPAETPAEEPAEEPAETPAEPPVEEPAAEETVQEPEEAAPALDTPEEDVVLDLLASTQCGTNLTWTLDASGVLTVSGIGDMYDYTYDTQPWCSDRASIKKIVVEEGVTSVGDYAFYHCYNATEIDLPASLTAIGHEAFYNCTAVKEIDIPGTITDWENNSFGYCPSLTSFSLAGCETAVPDGAFANCSKLNTVTLPEGVTGIGHNAFNNCSALAGIRIPRNVAGIGSSAFRDCAALTDIVIPDACTSIGYNAFDGCAALETVDLGEGVASIDNYAFRNCAKLKSLTLPDSLTTIGENVFYACTGLASVDFGEGIRSIGNGAFYSCTSLTELTLPDSLQTIADNGFRDCIKVETVTIGSGIRTIGDAAFGGCTALDTVDIDYYESMITVDADAFPADVTVTYKPVTADTVLQEWVKSDYTAKLYGDGRLVVSGDQIGTNYNDSSAYPWDAQRAQIKKLILEDGVVSIGTNAFSGFTGITELEIPDSVETIYNNAFYGCTALETVSIGSGILRIDGGAFSGCTVLTAVSIDAYEAVVSVGSSAFGSGVTITYRTGTSSEVVKAWEVGAYDETSATATLYADGRLVFEGVGEVSSTMPWEDYKSMITSVHVGDGITKLPSYAFRYCANLKTVTGMAGLTEIGSGLFESCSSLTSVELGDKITRIGSSAFQGCSSLTSIDLPDRLSVLENFVFGECSALTEVVIPDSVTNLRNDAFYKCTALETVTIGSGVYRMESEVFYGCTALETINWNARYLYYDCLHSGSHVFYNAGTKGDGITVNIGKDVQTIPTYLFYVSSAYENCQPKIKTVTLADDAQLTTIGNFAFYRLEELESVELGDKLYSIGDGAFNTCSALTEIDLPETLNSIGARAFYRTALKSATISDQVYSIGENAFGEISDPDFTIYGEAGSTAHIYADSENIPFNSYVRSGSQDGIDWSYDEQTHVLTLTGNGTAVLPVQNAQWNRYVNNATDIVIGSGITTLGAETFSTDAIDGMQSYTLTIGEDVTEIAAGAFAGMPLEEATFRGDQPAVTGGTSPFDSGVPVYYPAAAGWTDFSWDGCTFYGLTGQNVTLTLYDNFAGTSRAVTVTVEGGRPVSLYSYGSEALSRYQQSRPDVYLKGWNSEADGSGTGYSSDETVVFTQNTALYAQWPAYYTVKLNENNGLGVKTYTIREDNYLYLYNYYSEVQERYRQTMPGATLLHWNTAADGSGTQYNAYSSYRVSESMTLYAQWSLPDYVSVTLYDNNEYYPAKSEGVARHISGNSLSLTAYTENAQTRRRLHDLTMAVSGWNTAADGSGDSYAPDETINPTADLVLYAQWDLAADQVIASGDDWDVHWELYSFGTMIVSGEGEMDDYNWNGSDTPWYDYRTQIKKLVVESGVTSVGEYAFRDCTALTEVSLPDSLESIGYNAFYNCSALTTVTIDTFEMLVDNDYTFPDTVSVTWKTSDTQPVFTWDISEEDDESENCVTAKLYSNGLMEISGVGRMRGSLSNYSEFWSKYRQWIKEVRVLSGVTNVGYGAFSHCGNLTTVSLPDTLVSINSDAFYDCGSLTAINIDAYELLVTVNCTFPQNAVVTWKTTGGDNAVLKVWHVGEVDETDITATLYANGHLDLTGTGKFEATPWPAKITSVTISEGITNVAWSAFSGCKRLTEVSLPSTMKYIDGYAFEGCTALTSITIPDAVQWIEENAFAGCTALSEVQMSAALSALGEMAFYGCTALKTIAFPQTLTHVGERAFENCTALTAVTGLEKVESIEPSTFRGCTALTTVSDLLSAQYVDNYAFKDCTALTGITFGDALTEIGSQAFYNCTSLAAVTFCQGLTDIGDQSFENCTSLTSLTLPDSVTYVYYRAFANCSALTTLTVGADLYRLYSQVFADCTALTDIYWNAKNCRYLNESYSAFYNAGTAGSGITFTVGEQVKIIPAYLFYTSQLDEGKHPRLKTVRLAGESALTQVGDFAFYRCLELDSVQLGDKVTHILQGAFNTCPKLTEIHLPACLQHLGKKAFFRTGVQRADLGWFAQEIGVEAFAECDAAVTLYGYSGSFANLYADQYGLPFVPYETSGTDNGVSWNFDPVSRKLTFSGSGTITADGGWAEHALPVTGIVIGEGITALDNPAFAACTGLETVLFEGAAPALTAPSDVPFADGDVSVYCLDGKSGWNGIAGDSVQWNGCQVLVISHVISSLIVKGSIDDFDYRVEFSDNKGKWLDLSFYSRDIQTRYYATASDANLVSWNTAPDGSGSGYGLADLFRMGDADTLYAQWNVPTSVTLSFSGNGCDWSSAFDLMSGSEVALQSYSADAQRYYRRYVNDQAVLTGWNTNPDGSGKAYAADGIVIPMYNMTLYAQWQLPEAVEVASGEYGKNLKWTLNSHGLLTITGTGDIPDGNNPPWSAYSNRIASVVIGEGITRVGNHAFNGCHAITAVTLPESLVSIGYDAFWNCSLSAVTLGSGIRSVEAGAFMSCNTPFTVYADAYQVQVDYIHKDPNGSYASFPADTTFYWKTGSDTEVVDRWEIGSYDETDVTATLYASGRLVIQGKGGFAQAPWSRYITSVEIGEGITSIGENAFENCTYLTTVTTPETLGEVGYSAFDGCTALAEVSDLSNVTYFGNYAFRDCEKLADADLSAAEEIGRYAFSNAGISRADLSSARYVYNYAFEGCDNLTRITVGEDMHRIYDYAFANCPVLNGVTWECAETMDQYAESNLFLNSGKEGKGITLYAYSEHIPAYLFYTSSAYAGQEPNLTTVKTSTKYGTPVTIGEFAFFRAANLKSVSALNEIQSIGDGAFNSCTALTEITLGDDLQTLGAKAFFRTGLTSFAAGRSLENIGENAFGECADGFFLQGYADSTLREYADENAIPFREMATSGTEGSISWSFDQATGALTVTGTGAVTTAPWEHLAPQVESITLGEGITQLDDDVFAGVSITQMVFPASLNTLSEDCIDGVNRAYFLGAMPEVDSKYPEPPFDEVYYQAHTVGWSDCEWENDLYTFQNQLVTVTLCEQTEEYTEKTPVTGYVGTRIALKTYSNEAQERYEEAYGSGMTLAGWSDGIAYYERTGILVLQGTMTLNAVWESESFVVDGTEYPVGVPVEENGWSYDGNSLLLDGYNGGSIEAPGAMEIGARNTNIINGTIVVDGSLYFTVRDGTTTITSASGSTKEPLLDCEHLEINVEEGAVFNLSATGRAISCSGDMEVFCHGTINATAGNSYAIYSTDEMYLSGSGVITAQGARQALYSKSGISFRSDFDVYLSADATEPAAEYEATPYLRLEGSKWSMTLHANGGVWQHGAAAAIPVSQPSGEQLYLGNYSKLLSREGYVLTGWSDEANTVEFDLTDSVMLENTVLYAVWEKDLLTVDGKTYAIDTAASGTGWSYTPETGKTAAQLAISQGYSGKPVAFTRDLDVTVTADAVINGTAGVPGISVLGSLNLTVEEVDVTVTGGNGEHAVYSGGSLYLYNYGRTTLTGGAGGNGIHASSVHFYNYTGSALTVTGGARASAVWVNSRTAFKNVSGIITLVGGYDYAAICSKGWSCSGELRFYAGENASSLKRTDSIIDGRSYPYFRIQPKLVVVNLDANGGAIDGSQTAALSLLQAEDNSFLLLSRAAPVREGYLFTGWNTAADGSGTAYQDGERYIVKEDATLELFAQWEELPAPEASFGEGAEGQTEMTVKIPESLPVEAKDAENLLAVCYDQTTGQMLASAFGKKQSDLQWVFDLAQKENAQWMLFFLKDESHAPAFESLELDVQE